MPRALYNPAIDASGFIDAKRVILATGDYADYGDLFTASSLKHLIFPEKLDFSSRADRDYGSQKRFAWSATSIEKSATDPDWNDKDVWNFTGTDADIAFDVGSVPNAGQYSIVMAASLADRSQSFHHFFSIYSAGGAVTNGYLRFFNGTPDGITFAPSNASSTNSYTGTLPSENEPFVLGVDYDKSTNTSHLWLNDPAAAISAVTNHTASPPSDMSGYQYRIVNLFGNSSVGLKGKMGDVIILSGVWSTELRTAIFTALKNKYGIA